MRNDLEKLWMGGLEIPLFKLVPWSNGMEFRWFYLLEQESYLHKKHVILCSSANKRFCLFACDKSIKTSLKHRKNKPAIKHHDTKYQCRNDNFIEEKKASSTSPK